MLIPVQAAITASKDLTDLAAPAPAAALGSTGSPFAATLREAIGKVQELERDATRNVEGLMAGSGVDVHTALISTQKADAAFEMALSVRNKAVGAYQQLMGAQF